MISPAEKRGDKRVELVLQSMESLPTLPAVAMRVLAAVTNPSSSVNDLARIVQSDPALTVKLLKLTRRADAGVRKNESTDLNRAIVLLGFDAVRSAVLAISVFDSFQGPAADGSTARFNRTEFWKHSIAVGCCAELLAAIAPATGRRVDSGEAFVGGLLHDLGKIALDQILPKSFARVIEATDMLRGNIADLERRVIGLDHMVVGKRLAERWDLPAALRDCIWLHGQDPHALPANVSSARLVNLITLADVLVRQQHLGYSGNHVLPNNNQSLLEAVGLTATQVNDSLMPLMERIESRCGALGLGESTSGELYQQALSRANQEIGLVSQQLATKNRRLADRTKFFDALSGFQSEMRPDASVSSVLASIGQTAAAVIETPAVAVFSVQSGAAFASVVIVDADGNVIDSLVIDVPTPGQSVLAPPRLSGGEVHEEESRDGAGTLCPGVAPVGADLEWLLSAVLPKLANSNQFIIPLVGDHHRIGGVVWGATVNETERLAHQAQELAALAGGWGLALRVAQIREDSQSLAEQLAEANRRLQTVQEELLRSRMLISVGEMAAGAAHEMNNPLAVISGRSQLLAAQLTDGRQRAAARLIHEQSDRLSEIITELMDFAQPPRPTLANCSIQQVIGDAIAQAKELTDSTDTNIEVIATDVPSVTIDANQVTRALAEVIANAIQATEIRPGGEQPTGRVVVRVGHDSFSRRVVVDVTDDGCGMTSATLRRAFDPFFSALPAGRRRGMGLPKALRWVEGSGGSIRLESQPRRGTRAVVLLPAAAVMAAPETQTEPVNLPA